MRRILYTTNIVLAQEIVSAISAIWLPLKRRPLVLRDQNIVSAGLNTQSQAINHSIDTIFKDIASIEVYQKSNVQPQ